MRFLACVYIKGFLHHIGAESVASLFTPDAAFLEATKWRRNRELLVGVDPDCAGGNGLTDPPCLNEVTCPDPARKSIGVVVCDSDCLRFVGERRTVSTGPNASSRHARELFESPVMIVGE